MQKMLIPGSGAISQKVCVTQKSIDFKFLDDDKNVDEVYKTRHSSNESTGACSQNDMIWWHLEQVREPCS
jgi:hypothetical protein